MAAIALLGKTDGYLGNPKVRIPLPGYIEDASKILKNFGQGKRIDELVTSTNRAAEAAVPMGRDLLVSAVRSMNFNDAKNIVQGGETSVTNFFAEKTRPPLGMKFLPVVTQATAKSLDGLYLIIGEEKKRSAKTRSAPAARSSRGCLAL